VRVFMCLCVCVCCKRAGVTRTHTRKRAFRLSKMVGVNDDAGKQVQLAWLRWVADTLACASACM